MPRFYFHVFNDLETYDHEGQDLPDLQAARDTARKEARILAAETVREGHLILSHRIEVHDADGQSVFNVTFADVVQIEGN